MRKIILVFALVGGLFGGLFLSPVPQTPQPDPQPALDSGQETKPTNGLIVSGLEIVDKFTGKTYTGPVDLGPALERIASGGRHPHLRDGSVYRNISGALPGRPYGYYKEYVVPTPGFKGPGPQRLVIGGGGEIYYTPDHYETFMEIEP